MTATLEVLRDAAMRRREARAEFRTVVAALPPGAVEEAWERDLLTVEQTEEALAWRRRVRLAP